MTDANIEIRVVQEKRDSIGRLQSDLREQFKNGTLVATVSRHIFDDRLIERTVFSEVQPDFDCDFGVKMPVKAFSESRALDGSRIFRRSYENPDGSSFSRDYITGECTTRRKNGAEVTHDTALLQKMMELAGSVCSF